MEIIHSNYSAELSICIEGGGLEAHCQSEEAEKKKNTLVAGLFAVCRDCRLGSAHLHIWNV